MKQKLESILNKGKIFALAGLMFLTHLTLAAQSLKHYLEPRVGAIVPVAEKEQEYKPSFLIGGAYSFNVGKFGLEAGVDFFGSSGDYIKTKSLLSRINVSYFPFKPTAKIQPYLMTGISSLKESSVIDIPEFDVYDRIINKTRGIELGVGATVFDRIHGRLSYTFMPTSENVKGMISLTGGYRFFLGGKK